MKREQMNKERTQKKQEKHEKEMYGESKFKPAIKQELPDFEAEL